MTPNKLKTAIAEARRFIEKAQEALKAMEDGQKMEYTLAQNKFNAGARRASLDLTRSLADLRRDDRSDYGSNR